METNTTLCCKKCGHIFAIRAYEENGIIVVEEVD